MQNKTLFNSLTGILVKNGSWRALSRENINAVLYIPYKDSDRNTVIDSTFVCAFLSNT